MLYGELENREWISGSMFFKMALGQMWSIFIRMMMQSLTLQETYNARSSSWLRNHSKCKRQRFLGEELNQLMRQFLWIWRAVVPNLYGSGKSYEFRMRYRIHIHRVKSLYAPWQVVCIQRWSRMETTVRLGCNIPAVAFLHEDIKGEKAKQLVKVPITPKNIFRLIKSSYWVGRNVAKIFEFA